jgi:hypothetical protein
MNQSPRKKAIPIELTIRGLSMSSSPKVSIREIAAPVWAGVLPVLVKVPDAPTRDAELDGAEDCVLEGKLRLTLDG